MAKTVIGDRIAAEAVSPILFFFKYQQLLAFLRPFLLQYVVTKWVIAMLSLKGKISIPRSKKLARWRPKAATSSHFLTRLFNYSIKEYHIHNPRLTLDIG